MPCLSWLTKWNKRAAKPVRAKTLKTPETDQANDKPVPKSKMNAGTKIRPLTF